MPQKSIGLIEFKGLAGAIAAADAAAKAAEVDLAACEVTTGPGVMLRIEGELEAVQTALDAASTVARKLGQFLTAKVIPRPHEGLAPLLATRGYHNWLGESDPPGPTAAQKASGPKPVEQPQPKSLPKAAPKPQPGPSPKPATVADPPSAKTPPRPEPTPPPKPSAPAPSAPRPIASGASDMSELEKLPVVKLRKYARTIANLPIQGREISMANKTQLLEAIRSTRLN